jgi:hypothetical protein
VATSSVADTVMLHRFAGATGNQAPDVVTESVAPVDGVLLDESGAPDSAV